jgi:sarcosine oxidase subunit beta
MKTYDVIIIGGGITGFSTAYYLSKIGIKKVGIIEKNYPGSGSTGRCGTGIRQQFTTREHIVLMRESVKLWREWESNLQLPIHFRQGGYLWLLRDNEEKTRYEEYVRHQNMLGVPSKIITKEEIKEIVPQINTEKVVGASWCATDGNAYPQEVINALKLSVENFGFDVIAGEEVISMKIQNNSITEIATNKETYSAGFVVNGAGNGSKKIAQMVNINLPVENFRHQIVVSEPLETFLGPMVVNGELYFTQTYRGRIIGGTDTNDPPSESLGATVKFLEKFSNEIISTMPVLSSIKLMRQWAGFYVVSPDHHPILGPTEIRNFVLGCGYSGHGFMLGPIVGKLLASYVINSSFFLEEANKLTLERFKLGKLIQERAVIG